MVESETYNALMIAAVHSECVPTIEHLVESGLVSPFDAIDDTYALPQTVKQRIHEHFDESVGYHVPMIFLTFTAATAAAMLKHARAPEEVETKMRRYGADGELGNATLWYGDTGDAALAAEALEDHIAVSYIPDREEHRQLTRVILDFVARSSPAFKAACSPMWLRALDCIHYAPYFLEYVAGAGIPFPSTDKFLMYFETWGLDTSTLPMIAELGLGDAWLRVLPAADYLCSRYGRLSSWTNKALGILDLLLQYGNKTMQDPDWLKILDKCNAQTRLPVRVLHAVPAHVWEAHMQQHGTSRMHRSSQLHVGRLLWQRTLSRQRCPAEYTAAGTTSIHKKPRRGF